MLYPDRFEYARPGTLEEALELMADVRDHLVISGGTVGVLMLKRRLVRPELVVDVGAYADALASRSPGWIAMQLTGPYAIGSARVRGMAVYTNKAPLGPYRGAGRPEAAFFIERMMDLLADRIGMDPVDLRLANLPSGRFTSPLGLTVDPSRGFFEEGLRRIGYRDAAARGSRVGVSFAILIPAVYGGEGFHST